MLPTITKAPVRILLVDDHGVFRQALSGLLQTREEVAAVTTASNGSKGIEKARTWRPDIVLMDLVMPGISGIDAAREIRRLPGAPRVLMLAGWGDEDVLVASLRAGASGYVLKECDTHELMMAVSIVHQGGIYVSARLSQDADVVRLVERAHHRSPASRMDTLTPREREILRLIADGYTGRGIAELLHLSPKTVERHRERLMAKLGVHNKVQLTRLALRHGLATPDMAELADRNIA